MKIIRFLDGYLETILISGILALLAMIMLAAAVFRHLAPEFEASAVGAAGECLAWLVCLGISCGAARSVHLRLPFIEELAPERVRRLLAVFADAAFLVFALLGLAAGCYIFYRSLDAGSGFSYPPRVYLSAPTGFALTVFRLAERLSGKGSPARDGSR